MKDYTETRIQNQFGGFCTRVLKNEANRIHNEYARQREKEKSLDAVTPEGYFAGELIMKAGLRGYQVGGARVSDKHCGFVINTGNATAEDVMRLMSDVQNKVKETFGVELEPEVIIVK